MTLLASGCAVTGFPHQMWVHESSWTALGKFLGSASIARSGEGRRRGRWHAARAPAPRILGTPTAFPGGHPAPSDRRRVLCVQNGLGLVQPCLTMGGELHSATVRVAQHPQLGHKPEARRRAGRIVEPAVGWLADDDVPIVPHREEETVGPARQLFHGTRSDCPRTQVSITQSKSRDSGSSALASNAPVSICNASRPSRPRRCVSLAHGGTVSRMLRQCAVTRRSRRSAPPTISPGASASWTVRDRASSP
jgi:hypothetical protein